MKEICPLKKKKKNPPLSTSMTLLRSYTTFEGNTTLCIGDFQRHDNAYCKRFHRGSSHLRTLRRRRVATSAALRVKHSSNPQHGLESFIATFSFTGRRWDATSLILSTQRLSKPAICFDWHSFVREERQRADSRWCKRRARNTFLSVAEEQIIFPCILQKRLRNLEALKCSVAAAARSIYWQWCFPVANFLSLWFYCIIYTASICYLPDQYLDIATYIFLYCF